MDYDQDPLARLELYSLGKPVSHMGEVLALDLFKNGTMDIYLDDDHYRMTDIWPIVNGLEIGFGDLKRTRFLQFVDGHWIDSPKRDFEGFISTQALMMALHGADNKLLFVVFAYGYGDNKVVRFVLYPEHRLPRPGDHQIIGWRDYLNPIIGNVLEPGVCA